MDPCLFWELFLDTGAPEFYLMYVDAEEQLNAAQ